MRKKTILLSMLLFGATVTMNAQTGIGTAQPNQSAQLDITSSDKGVLIPRIALTSATQQLQTTVANQTSLLIYNTATVAAESLTPGYYYWDSNKWNRIVKDDEVPATVNTTANNGLTKTGNNIALGGNLTGATTVTATAANTLAVEGLQQTTTIATDKIVVADASDFAKTRNTTVYKTKVASSSGLLTLGLITDWQPLNFNVTGAETFYNGTTDPMAANGTLTIEEDGVYAVGFYFRYGDGLNLSALDLLGSGFSGVRINKNGSPLDLKSFSGANVNLSNLIASNGNALNVPIVGSLPLVGSIVGLLTGTLDSAGVLSLLDIGVLNLAISSTEINTIYQFNAGDTITFDTRLGGLVALSVLSDSEASLYIYKISDL